MSAPRWTLNGRDIRRDDVRIIAAADCMTVPDAEFTTLLRRIVSLLNATELSSDAVAELQVAVMESGQFARIELERMIGDPHNGLFGDTITEQRATITTLDALTDTLNHTVRMYVELDEEASIALDEPKEH